MTEFRFKEEQECAERVESLLQNPCDREKILREYQQRAMRAKRVENCFREAVGKTESAMHNLEQIAENFYQSLPRESSFFAKEGGEHYFALCTALRLMQDCSDAIKGSLNDFSIPDSSNAQQTEAQVLFGYAMELEDEIASVANSFAKELARDREKTQSILKNTVFCKDLMRNFLARELPHFYERVLAASDAENGGRSFRMGEVKSLFGELLHRIQTVRTMLQKQKTGGTVI
jgi:hypothetical protein